MIKHRIIFKGMNSCLYIYQSRFRANHATDTRLSRKTNMMLKSTENGKQNGLIKNKTILILFNIYCFFCFIRKCLFRSCKCGVPPASIAETLLFLLYINDIPQALSSSHTYPYADDSCIFLSI